ncbi:protoporphyrinogen oxidase [Spirosoma sp. BT702]|uniref:Coproporphyrinogen III oxidase n=1 Tax=Spirosoma profusum TaxID=2771354 RepID=A0A926XU31_9BACT|nr:protoporphyrinogen oxidase [Spirosoma profusum]MBD2699655.1 protoporphyrinogen oxidase [Spirosoma profusum]
MTVGIIGAGISGLTLAYELQKRGIDYHIWEAADQPGGYMQSRWETGETGNRYLRELGPNSLLGDGNMLLWLDELGLTPKLVFSNPVSKARYIFRNGTYRKLPSGPLSLLFGNFFSWSTKLAIFRERNNRTTSPPGETLAQFFRRRFSAELVDYAVGPFVAGIYAGNPENLLVSETFPSLLQYEKEFGSVLRGFIKNQSAAGRRQSFSFQDGMQSLPNTLASRLKNISLATSVAEIRKTAGGWEVDTLSGTQTVDTLVLTVSTDTAAKLVDTSYPAFAQALRQVSYPPMTAVHSAFKKADVQHPLDGFGGLNPQAEGQFASGHIWSSSVFNGRCPTDEVLFTTFVGGAGSSSNTQLPDSVLIKNVQQELATNFGIKTDTPTFQAVQRWERAIPQYDAAIVAVKEPVRMAEKDNLFVCANWYGGVSLSDCIGKGRKLAGLLAQNSSD